RHPDPPRRAHELRATTTRERRTSAVNFTGSDPTGSPHRSVSLRPAGTGSERGSESRDLRECAPQGRGTTIAELRRDTRLEPCELTSRDRPEFAAPACEVHARCACVMRIRSAFDE